MSFGNRYHRSRMSSYGMVAAAHPLAALAGSDVLRAGGNAMDACLSMAAVTGVVLPHMCGLGGDTFLIYYDSKSRGTWALNGSGPAGDGATISRYRNQGKILPQDGIHSVAVPGTPAALDLAAASFGSKGLTKCMEYGSKVACNGFSVSLGLSRAIAVESKKLAKCGATCDIFMPGGRPLRPGDTLKQPDMARTLREFGRQGAPYFYRGEFSQRFYELSNSLEGAFLGGEFARFVKDGVHLYEPLKSGYRGYTILETAPVSQGFTVLEMMNILEELEVGDAEPGAADAIHFMIEAKRIAYRDRNDFAGDPDHCGFNAAEFISKKYGRAKARLISAQAALPHSPGAHSKGGDTTSFVAWDRSGNVCSFIHSIAFQFGSGLTVPGTGVLLNNRAGRSFLLAEGHPNSLLPGRRPMHTLNCYMALKDGEPFVAGGTPGGDGQPQWNVQMLSLMLDHGAGPQDAVDYPRWTSIPGTDVATIGKPVEVRLESRFPDRTVKDLRRRGHKVHVVGEWGGGGGAQIIMKDPRSGALLGGSDGRVGGLALGS